MPSLRDILATQAPLLVIDTASRHVQVGWCEPTRSLWTSVEEEANTGIFRALETLSLDPGAARALAFCAGPGSILGIRTAAMVVRTWALLAPRPVFRYASLTLLAHALGRGAGTVIADARRATWHAVPVAADGSVGSPSRVPASELQPPLWMPEAFRHWAPLPAGTECVPYAVGTLLGRTAGQALFEPTEAPDAFVYEEPTYVTWTPHVHRPPAPLSP